MVVSEPESPVLLDPAVFELLSEARSACVVVAESSTASSSSESEQLVKSKRPTVSSASNRWGKRLGNLLGFIRFSFREILENLTIASSPVNRANPPDAGGFPYIPIWTSGYRHPDMDTRRTLRYQASRWL